MHGAHTLSQHVHKGKYPMRTTDTTPSEAPAVIMPMQRVEPLADERRWRTVAQCGTRERAVVPVKGQCKAGAGFGVRTIT